MALQHRKPLKAHELPLHEGLLASTLQLPPGAWATILDCLCAHFANVSRATWLSRMSRGLVLDAHGLPLHEQSPFKVGSDIHYYREVEHETPIPFHESILFADDHLLVVDKPHFLPVAPVGAYVQETLLTRLRQRLNNPHLVPLHRLDRGTAGLVLFSCNPETRARYVGLFRERKIVKRYECLAPPLKQFTFPVVRKTRLVQGKPFVRMQEADGAPNSETRIEVLTGQSDIWHYALYPHTGKTHQLRVHMAALGAPIINDHFYPTLLDVAPDDFSKPLKLLAQNLRFADPIDGLEREFSSGLSLF